MNITDVLTLVNTESNSTESTVSKEGVCQGDSALFSLLFNSVMGAFVQAEGQKTEELVDESSPSVQYNGAALSIIGQNSYLQILQNLFPAGKEANSGLEKEQDSVNLSILNIPGIGLEGQITLPGTIKDIFTNTIVQDGNVFKNIPIVDQLTGSGVQDIALPQKNLGLEGIMNPGFGEIKSLDSKELDKYIEISERIKELSGTIELKNGQKTTTRESFSNYDYSLANTGLTDNTKLNTENTKVNIENTKVNIEDTKVNIENTKINSEDIQNTDKTASQASDTIVSTAVKDEGLPNQASAQGNQGEQGQELTDSKSIQPLLNKVDGSVEAEVMLDTKVKDSISAGRAWEQVLDILKKQELNSQREIKELTINLHPAELGKVNVSLRLENGQLNLMMSASEQTTNLILQNNIQELKNGLTQMGVDCGTFEMGYQHNGQKDSNGAYSSNDGGYRYKLREEETSVLTSISSYSPYNGSGSKINLSA